MKDRIIVQWATGRYVKGALRFAEAISRNNFGLADQADYRLWADEYPPGSKTHQEFPYQAKSHAIKWALEQGYKQVLWADASVVPIAPLDRIWARAAEHGAWISDNGYTTYEWCPDTAYPLLFETGQSLDEAREQARAIPHPVATTFCLNLSGESRRIVGLEIFVEYFRLCQTPAIQGPWTNSPYLVGNWPNPIKGPCGPPDVRGARHDQLILGVVAWRAGLQLTSPPAYFSYAGSQTEETILIAQGSY